MDFFIADTHFFDRYCIKFDGRPFANVEDMNETLIRNWNAAVGEGDRVFVVGDYSYGNGADLVSTAQRLKGKKILIRGNHDNDVNLKYAFDEIYDFLEVRLDNATVVLCHYPLSSFKDMQKGGTVHIYGHVHNSIEAKIANDVYNRLRALPGGEYRFEAYNVGCMQPLVDYTPRTLGELRARALKYPVKFDH
ncbi:MAG: metallophosphoesterase family protein [Clostridia bacterium]|nr:metallophosphoesterase family protein [Clostridia bacterium]